MGIVVIARELLPRRVLENMKGATIYFNGYTATVLHVKQFCGTVKLAV